VNLVIVGNGSAVFEFNNKSLYTKKMIVSEGNGYIAAFFPRIIDS